PAPNSAPSANSTGRVEVVAGGPAVTREIATVSDVQDAVSTLAVTVTGTPAGMNMTVSNDTGIIAATVAGQCLTAPGTYTITLTVEDSGGQTGTTTFKVQVDAPGERVQDTSFEDGAPNPYWDVTLPGTGARICQPGACAIDPTAGPRTGAWWVRFGGPTGV